MGKGDRKTKKGKIRLGSYGKVRPRKKDGVNSFVKKSVKKVEEITTKNTEKKPVKKTGKKSSKKKA